MIEVICGTPHERAEPASVEHLKLTGGRRPTVVFATCGRRLRANLQERFVASLLTITQFGKASFEMPSPLVGHRALVRNAIPPALSPRSDRQKRPRLILKDRAQHRNPAEKIGQDITDEEPGDG
jgi:hypothetical protein